MKAVVATDQAAEAAGITFAERPEPTPAINDVVVEVHASGFVPAEWEWPSTSVRWLRRHRGRADDAGTGRGRRSAGRGGQAEPVDGLQ